jgi:hypothetical protein
VADISFKNADGTARNTPRTLDATEGTDTNTGEVRNPVEEVDVSALERVEDEVRNAIATVLHPEQEQ